VVYIGVVWGREQATGFILTERERGTNLLGEPARGTRGLDPSHSPSLAFFAFLDFSEGSRILFMKFGGCSGSQSTENSEMSTLDWQDPVDSKLPLLEGQSWRTDRVR